MDLTGDGLLFIPATISFSYYIVVIGLYKC